MANNKNKQTAETLLARKMEKHEKLQADIERRKTYLASITANLEASVKELAKDEEIIHRMKARIEEGKRAAVKAEAMRLTLLKMEVGLSDMDKGTNLEYLDAKFGYERMNEVAEGTRDEVSQIFYGFSKEG